MSAYRAPWWLPGGHLQTVYAVLAPAPRVPWRRERIETPDGDFVDLDWVSTSTPDDAPVVVVLHGLEGSSTSHYAIGLLRHAKAQGWRAGVLNFRSCSGEPNRLPRFYHSGDTADLDAVVRHLLRSDPARRLGLVGVSLGGNVLLKWLGERGAAAAQVVRRAAAVSAPLDLAAAGHALDRGVNRRLYTRVFLASLKAKVSAKIALRHVTLEKGRLSRVRTLREFDDLFTAPLHGFRDADDYWTRASSASWLEHIRVPTLVLNARNDPFLPRAALESATRKVSRDVVLEFPASGGHAGFPGRGQWLARRVIEFLSQP